MPMNLETLIPYDRIIETPNSVFDLVDQHNQVILLRNNAPAYIIMKAAGLKISDEHDRPPKSNHTLQEAMKLVLQDTEGKQMHAADLSDIIYKKGLYFKKDGSKAKYNQIRARCGHYPDMFEALPGNIIKLKT
jgi:antitoxin Phd